jgi:dTDP-4-amino-4,6-dideoxygalactose transaminase
MNIPFVRPSPPKLSLALAELEAMEESGIFSNFGPINTRFEQAMLERFFGGEGACMTVCNATIGLMLAIKEAVGEEAHGKFALMPAFTFAAAAHAALWCGLIPLLCDVDAETWAADPAAEAELLARYTGKIAVIVPYATFGFPIDVARYDKLARQLGVPVVVDGAASLGTFDAAGRGFGTGFTGSVAFSMHATKSFAVGEAALMYSADPDRIARLRTMSSFGFGEPRTATMPGLNGKVSELVALVGELRLADYDSILRHRAELFAHYRSALPELQFQPEVPGSQAHQFVPALLPSAVRGRRAAIRTELAEHGIATGAYFCPHLYQQPYFQKVCRAGRLTVSDDVAARIISLPLFDKMTHEQVDEVIASLRPLIRVRERARVPQKPSRVQQPVTVAYTAASAVSAKRRLIRSGHKTYLSPMTVLQQEKI